MKALLQTISYIGLALSLIPSFLVWFGKITLQTNLNVMVAGMFLWFGAAVFWIKEDKTEE